MENNLWNMCTNIKNNQIIKNKFALQNLKKNCEPLLKILWDEGFILGYTICTATNKITIGLKYRLNNEPVISSIKLISKPGHRKYYSIKQLWKIDSNNSFIILSTDKGLKSITQCKKMNIGGEPLIIIN